ncbi:MAG: lysophospholipid acyltransferase family protein [Calditrichaeota bacterium]|nr:lysophospholipid acyltransferase family protein [Calditrichota bacterium]
MAKAFRQRIVQKLILFAAVIFSYPLLALYFGSLRITLRNWQVVQGFRRSGRPFILALWHENLLMPLWVMRGHRIYALVSQHFDGEVIARVLWTLGFGSIRGSSTRGGQEAYRQIRELLSRGRVSVAITPDGPTGPRRQAKLGTVRLSSETGVPIVAMGIAASRYRRLGSWDRFRLIYPFSRVVVAFDEPFQVPPDLSLTQLKEWSGLLEKRLNRMDEIAQHALAP